MGGGDTATVTVKVTGATLHVNTDAFTVARGTTNALDVLANDLVLPPSGVTLTVTGLGTPSLGGVVWLNGVGPGNLVSYAPDPARTAPFVESFSYTVTSGGLVSNGVVSVTVLDRGNSLEANNDKFTVIAGSGTTSLDVLGNDAILPGPTTNLVITSFTSNSVLGTVSLNAARTRLLYKPSSTVTNQFEPPITYTISDNAGGTDTASVSIRVVPSGFIANDDTFVVVKNSTNTLPVMINDVILPNLGQTLFISGIGIGSNAPNHGGSVTINGPGTGLIYAPAANFTGAEDFTYEISDGSPARALGHVHVVVFDNSPATSNPDTYRVARDSANNALLVLKNDYPLPKTPGAYTITGLRTNGVHATISINGAGANNSLLYSPAAGFIGTDRFSYEFADTFGNKGTNTVVVTVGNLAPLDDAFSVLSGSSANMLDVLANDPAYPDSSTVRPISLLGVADQGGTVAIAAGGTAVLYTPTPGFVGEEHFTYSLKDDSTNLFTAKATVKVYPLGSDRDTNTVTMTIIGVNDAPTITSSAPPSLITDKQTATPFANLRIGDLDRYGMELQTVTVIQDNLAKGVLTNLGGFVQGPTGTFTIQGTPTNVTAAIRGLVFVPVENRIVVPTIENAVFTILANDTHVTTTNSVSQPVQAANDPPLLGGTVSGLRVYHRGTLRPFYKTLITEVDDSSTQPLVIRVTLDNPIKGYFTALGGFTSNSPGIYVLTNTAAAATAALRGLIFVPTTANRVVQGTNETTRFTISVDDRFAPPVLDTNTTVTAIAGLVARLQQAVQGASSPDDEYGGAVAATRDFVATGQRMDDNNSHAGSAYVYARRLDGSEAWDEVKKLIPPGGLANDNFGTALGMSGEVLVVGAPGDDTRGSGAGAAYIFSRNQGGSNQWGFVQKLTASDGAAGDNFGDAIAIDGDTIVVGADSDNDLGADSGSVYVFTRGATNWVQSRKVLPTDGAAGDRFGWSVALSADTLVAGAPLRDQSAADSGAAYVFSRHQGGSNQWGQIKKLLPSDPGASDQFGYAVAVNVDTLAVGAPFNDDLGADSGSTYLFTRHQGGSNQWGQVKKLLPADGGSAGDNFGRAVGVDGDNIVVGSPQDAGAATGSGSAYLFSRNAGGTNQWNQTERFLPGSNSANGNFGSAVAVARSTLVVGAPFEQPGGGKTGTIYIYRLKYNNPPLLVNPLLDRYVAPNVAFSFLLPPSVFDDPDLREALALSTGFLPAWVTFDPLTGGFSGFAAGTNLGAHLITVLATDEDQQSASGSFNLIVGFSPPDTNAPVFTPPANISVQCDGDVPAPNPASLSVIDNTDPSPTVTYVSDVTNGTCPKIITRTYRATDWFGNSNSVAQFITVQDTTPPTITCSNRVVQIGTAWSFTAPLATDNCGTANVSPWSTVTNMACGKTFTATRVWLAADACGNSTTCTQTVAVVDTIAPTLTSPPDVTVPCLAGVPAPNFAGGSVSDPGDANPVVLWAGDLSAGTNPVVITRTYRATDACGNTNTSTQKITIYDAAPPTLICGTNQLVEAGTAWNFIAPGTNDNCGTVTLTVLSTVTNALCGTTFTASRAWVAQDSVGNSTTCTQVVTVVDTIAPTMTPPPEVTIACASGIPAANFAGGSVFDLGDPSPVIAYVGDSSVGTNPVVITRTYSATDTCGNSNTVTQKITIHDTTPPTLTCGINQVVEAGTAWSFTTPGTNDNCGSVTLTVVSTVTNALCGTTFTATRAWLAEDAAGNSTTCTQIVSVVDTLAPTMTPPPDVSIVCVSDIPAADFAGGSVFDLGDPSPVIVHVGDASVGNNPVVITRTYSATDACGNSNTVTQKITLQDSMAPTLSCPADLVLTADTNTCTALNVALGTPTAGDNCSASVTNDAPLAFALGATTVIWTATDPAGNSASCTQLVTVVDSTLAITIPPSNQTNQPGSNATFSVTATGCATLAYQWYFFTNALAGETNDTLTLTNLQRSQVGDYLVVASNAGGSVTSSVAVLMVNQPPIAQDDGAVTTQNQSLVITAAGVLANDSDPDLDPTALTSVSATSTNGALVSWTGGDITYTPVLNFFGTDRFSYTIADTGGATATAAVEVLVVKGTLPAADQLSIQNAAPDRVLLYRGTPGAMYELERSTDLQNWAPIYTNTPLSGIIQYVDPSSPAARAFYRVRKN